MTDDLKNRGAADRARINVNEPWELKWWCNESGVTEEHLRRLVQQHGVSATKIREALAAERRR